ncbi:Dehydrodolichyl diphosphate synthase 6 [Apostasia shenzhenica]|uniref:Alkyl transferase n=1 Tax=Apostasia shenzhenica TaxID=1088818 RepID=A0A2I0ASW7_9ASPA|nr:Dehydrodolichyl diphosphate synthase 6 [Apostasia shenzhenica]
MYEWQDPDRRKHDYLQKSTVVENLCGVLRRFLFSLLAIGPMPNHIAFIMDGNRRYAKSKSKEEGGDHRAGFSALISVLRYCYEMGVNYVTVYAFSIDNFKRKPEEVNSIMNLLKEKIDELLQEETIIKEYGVKINFLGNLNLLDDVVRLSVERAMRITSSNTGLVLSVCVAYTSTNEILRAVESSCFEKRNQGSSSTQEVISVDDLENHLHTNGCPDPDILIRTSGETRLSNFLLWQSSFSHLQNPAPLWPEFSLRHLVWAVLHYQRAYPYLKEIRERCKKIQ